MNPFVTGGTGYPGSAVTAALLADGHTVRAHVRSIASADRLPAGAGPVAGDLGDAAWLRARADESDGVVHAASPNDATSGSFDAALLDVALSALSGSDRPLVYTGGTRVHCSGNPITEESPVNPPPMAAWRPAILQRLQTAAADGIRTVVIAPANVYGAGAGIPAMPRGAPTAGGPEPALLHAGNGKHRFASVHRDAIATLYAPGARTAPAGSYYLGANAHSPTMTELATARHYGREHRAPVDPGRRVMKAMSQNEKTTVQAASASRMDMRREARNQLVFLSAQFLLGMAVNLIGQPSETTGAAHAVSTVLLGLHALVAIGLLAGAVMVIRAARGGGKRPRQLARSGAVLIGLTVIAGIMTVITKNNWWSYTMAAGFIASMLLYGSLLVRAQSPAPQPEQPS